MELDIEERQSIIELPVNVQELLLQSELRRQLKSQPVYLKYFWKILLIISVFYSLPSIQFVFFQYSDSDIKCYFNYKCVRPFLGLTAFNNVLSNIFYIVSGSSFLLITYLTRAKEDGIHGLHTDMSLYYSMGLTILLEGFFSALYHVCPSRLNFQFDTTFMLIGSGLLFFTLHQKRHATYTAGAFKAFTFFSLFIFFNFLSLTNINPYVFWALFMILFAYISIFGSAYLLAHRRLGLNPSVTVLWSYYKKILQPSTIEDKPRFIAILFSNVFSWACVIAFAILGIAYNMSKNFSNLILGVIILNFLVYLFYYIAMKIKYGEKVYAFIWVLFVVMVSSWGLGIYFFEIPVTNKFLSFDESKLLNRPCVVFDYFDTHDVWHFFSSIGLFSIMSIVYFIDFDLRKVPRSLIHVF
ncbi:transmembrane protein [Tieghemostelium lacteum]|uniref:Transmembrane protein n=1 Tax=Tieghemostelium lacteum TaxID=361077 RepID=A0A151ZG85_TIELA|nr:transmembrane protein [Tieghemostelium lacteum]|eukprot:KYQ92937.1 transmembrane protein [Tieghemostelium lacteum]